MNWVDVEKPTFSRGLRIVDNEEGNTVTVDGEEADNLIFSLAYIFNKEENKSKKIETSRKTNKKQKRKSSVRRP